MNKKWSEKTTFEKVLDIIAGVALCVWLVFETLERENAVQYADVVNYIAISVICICEAISFWKVKRILSYIAIAGIVCMVAAVVLQTSLAV